MKIVRKFGRNGRQQMKFDTIRTGERKILPADFALRVAKYSFTKSI